MFGNLQDKLDRAFKVLKGHGQISEINIAQTMKEIRRALLDADVSFRVAKDFTNRVRDKALGQNVLNALKPGQVLTKIVSDELTDLMGGEESLLHVSANPTIILIAGLQGSGKTTFSGKLAHYLKTKKGKSPLLVAGDVYRPAAMDQLEVIGKQVDVPVFIDRENKNPVDIAEKAVALAKQQSHNVVIVDTAGRLAVDQAMMKEISKVKEAINPTETLFVVDSMTGQDAVNTAKEFNDRIDFSGVVLTKLDGDTRGGAALSIREVVNKPIKFIGTGEKMDALDVFYPKRMAERILGMGDVVSLVEKVQEQFDEEEARKLQKKIAKNQFNFNDFYDQIQQIKKMGNMKDLMGMMPGIGKMMKDVEVDENAFTPIEAIIKSMTPSERENPKLLNNSRKKRIAVGAGMTILEVNKLIKQFEETSKMMKLMSNKSNMAQMMKNIPGLGGMGMK